MRHDGRISTSGLAENGIRRHFGAVVTTVITLSVILRQGYGKARVRVRVRSKWASFLVPEGFFVRLTVFEKYACKSPNFEKNEHFCCCHVGSLDVRLHIWQFCEPDTQLKKNF